VNLRAEEKITQTKTGAITGNGSLVLDNCSFDVEGERAVPTSPESVFGDNYIRLDNAGNETSGESDPENMAKEIINDQPLT
jgi:hypothetical protein